MRVGAPVSHRAIIHNIGASVGAKPDIGWAVEPVDVAHERLVAGVVTGEVLDFQGERGVGQLARRRS